VSNPAQHAFFEFGRDNGIQIEIFYARKDNPGTGAVQITHRDHVMTLTNGFAKHDASLDMDHLDGTWATGRVVEGLADSEVTQDRQTSTRVISTVAQQTPVLVDVHPRETRLLWRHGLWVVHHIDQRPVEICEQISSHVCQLSIHFAECLRSEEVERSNVEIGQIQRYIGERTERIKTREDDFMP